MTTHEVSYNRPKPECWNDIVACAAKLAPETYDTSTSIGRRGMVKMLRYLDGLNPEELEDTAYYGMGLGMQHMLPDLLSPDTRQQATSQIHQSFRKWNLASAELLFYSQPSYEKTAIARDAGIAAMLQPATRAFNALPSEEHFAADSLVTAMHMRRLSEKASWFSPSHLFDDLRSGAEAAKWVALNSLTGALEIISLAVRKRNDTLPPLESKDLSSGPFLRATAWMSRLHNEEFSNKELIWSLFTTDEAGNLIFDRQALPGRPQLPGRSERHTKTMHDDRRLECPAFNVGGLQLLSGVVAVVWDAAHGGRSPDTISGVA